MMPHTPQHNRVLRYGECVGAAATFVVGEQQSRVPIALLELVLEGELELDDIPSRDLVFRSLLGAWMAAQGFAEIDDE